MRRDWVFITRAKNWDVCLQHRLFGFDSEYRATIEQYVSVGDRAIVYVASPVKGVVGVIRVDEVLLNEGQDVGWTNAQGEAKLFPDRVRWSWLRELEPAITIAKGSEYLRKVQWLPDKQRWNVYLQVALIRACSEDVEVTLDWVV